LAANLDIGCSWGLCRAIEIEGNGKEIWRKKCGQQVSGRAGGRRIQQDRTELDGDR